MPGLRTTVARVVLAVVVGGLVAECAGDWDLQHDGDAEEQITGTVSSALAVEEPAAGEPEEADAPQIGDATNALSLGEEQEASLSLEEIDPGRLVESTPPVGRDPEASARAARVLSELQADVDRLGLVRATMAPGDWEQQLQEAICYRIGCLPSADSASEEQNRREAEALGAFQQEVDELAPDLRHMSTGEWEAYVREAYCRHDDCASTDGTAGDGWPPGDEEVTP